MTLPQPPLIPEVGIIALVPDSWDVSWQTRHHLLTRLARYFHLVWVNPAPYWRDMFKFDGLSDPAPCKETLPPGFIVYTPPIWLPRLYRPFWLANFSFDFPLKQARHLLLNRGCRSIILYLWRPEFQPALFSIPYDLSCYHIDDEYSFSNEELPLDEQELSLIARVDQVFVHSPGLLEKKGKINPHTTVVPNGVDYEVYSRLLAEPSDLAKIPRPRIGYTGIIKQTLDWLLLLRLTEQHPEWSFVFVGPTSHHPELTAKIGLISKRKNVYFLGAKSTQEVPPYPQHFDVCIMPYEINAYTQCIYPLKLHEYMASGRPTVGTRIRSLESFAEVVALAQSPEEWSVALEDALSPASNSAERRTARQAVAQRHDWQFLVARVATIMARRVGYAERLQRALEPNLRDSVLEGQ